MPTRATRSLPQDFTKFLAGGCHITLCGACDAHGTYFRRAREWTVEQAFTSHEFEDRVYQSDTAAGLHFGDQ